MGRSKALILATLVATGASSAAFGADLLPPPPQLEAPPPMDVGGGWYLRGDVGVGALQMTDWRSTLAPNSTGGLPNGPIVPEYASLGDTTFVDAGFGYQFNRWFRADVTGEYRSEAPYRAGIGAIWSSTGNGVLDTVGADNYSAGLSTALFLANGYIDLGCWHGLTPFVGAGVGLASHSLRGLNDFGTGFGVAADTNKTNFAWAVMGGLAMNVTPNLKLEVGYRYIDMGSLTSHPIECSDALGCFHETHGFHVASQDVRLGFRYALGGSAPPTYAPPLMTKY